jgi:hypothetical protein
MDTDRFWNKTNFEIVPLDPKFAISFFFYILSGNAKLSLILKQLISFCEFLKIIDFLAFFIIFIKIFFNPLSMFHLLGEFKNHLSLSIFNKVAKY